MKIFKIAVIIIITYVLQITLISGIDFWGVCPNMFLVVVCGVSFLFGSTLGGVTGGILGLLNDMSQGRAIGLCAFLCMYIGIFAGQFNKRFFKDNYIVAVVCIFLITGIYEIIINIFGSVAYSQLLDFGAFCLIILKSMLLNAIASIIVYPILLKINIGIEIDRNIFGR